jgi:WD40 repeat protein
MRIIESKHQRPLNLLAIGANGLIAAASSTFGVAGDIEVWDATTGARRFVHREPNNFLLSLVFHTNGRTLLFSKQEAACVLDPTPGAVPREPIHPDHFPELALAPDGTRLLVCENHPNALQAADGAITYYAVGAQFDLTALWSTGEESVSISHPVFNPDGARFAVTASDLAGVHVKHAVQFRDPTGKLLVTIPADPAEPVRQLAFTADGSKLLVRAESRTVRLFDAATGGAAGELVHPRRPYVTALAVHPRGPVACARTDGTVTFWDAQKREQLRTLDWKAGKLVSVAFAPDGALAAAGTEDGKVIVWDVDV